MIPILDEKGDSMKEIPKKHLAWFEAKQTERRGWFSPAEPFVVRGDLRNWMKGIGFIVSSFLLFGISFSPAWGNPNDDDLPNKVLIPIHELMNGEEQEPDQTSSDLDQQETSVQSIQKKEQETPEKQEGMVSSSKHDNEKKEITADAEKKKPSQPHQENHDGKNVENDLRKKDTISAENKSQPKRNRSDSEVQTENGGTLPDTATPFGALLARGLALVLLGIGFRFIATKKQVS